MPGETDDAKLEQNADSSSESEQDANTQSDSSSEETSTEGDAKTIADVVNETFEKHEESSTSTEKEGEEKSDVQELDKTAEEKEDSEATKEEVPFHDHPRWKEVVGERDTLKGQVTELDKWRRDNEGIVQAHKSVADFCIENRISPQEMQQALQFMAKVKTDPEAALDLLRPIWDGLLVYKGEVLPQDLKDEVEAGVLTQERAKELARLRAQTTFKAEQGKANEQRLAEDQRQRFVRDAHASLTSWEKVKREKDPDFQPKAKETDEDRKYEWFIDKFQKMLAADSPKTTQEVVAVAEKAYESVSRSFSKFAASNGKGHKVLSTTRSSATPAKKPETIRDVVRQTAARHGVLMDDEE